MGSRPRSLIMKVDEGTPGKWSLWATHPTRLICVAELHSTIGAAETRAALLTLEGYKADIFLAKIRAND